MKKQLLLIALASLVILAACKKDTIDMAPTGNVEIPAGMSGSDIIVTNFSEEVVPNENGNFTIGSSKMLVAKNAVNNKPVYFALYSTDFNVSKNVVDNIDYELSAKETAIFITLNIFPNGLSEISDEKLNALKNMLYSLNCVQQLELAVSDVINQYGYLNPNALANSIETVRSFLFDQLIVPITGNKNNRSLNPPHADPDHFGQLAKIEFLDEQYDANHDSWNVLCRCWNGFAIWVGVIEGKIMGEDMVAFQPELMVDYVRPLTQSDALSLENYLNWNIFVERFQDLYGTISEYFNNHQQYFQTAGKPNRDVHFNLNSSQDAICYVGPEVTQVLVANVVGNILETAKFILDQLIGPEFSPETNLKMLVSEALLDEELIQMIVDWVSSGYDIDGWKAIANRELHNIGVGMLNSGTFDFQKFASWNEYTAMYSTFSYISDLVLTVIEAANFNSFYFEVFDNPGVVTVSVEYISCTTAMVNGRIASQGTQSIVERGVCYSTTPDPTLDCSHVVADIPSTSFSCSLENLQSNKTYYVKAYAINSSGLVGYGNEISFKTVDVPTVTTLRVTDITNSSAMANGMVTFSNMSQIIERGFLFDTSPDGLWYGSIGCDGVVYEGTSQNNFNCSLTGLYSNAEYYVRAYAKTAEGIGYGDVVSFYTLSDGGGIHEYVDLGLPSGLLWATCNIGANAPEDYGDYFAWGETQPKSTYNWSTYQYANGTSWDDPQLTKYCNNPTYGYNGFTDDLTTLLPEDDAATANWGGNWRMPTKEEWQELYNNTTHTWTTQNGVNGRLFTASNGNSLFLPAAGYRYDGSLDDAGSGGYYWSGSLDSDFPNGAWGLYFGSGGCRMSRSIRFSGFTVRPVRSARQN